MSVPEAVWNEIRALEQANAAMKTRIDELHDQIAATARRVDRLAALESPAPAPDPVCQCGFPYDGKCMRRDCPGVGSECANCGHQLVDGSCVNCSYVPAEQPALDPGFRIAIREAVVRMAALNVTVQEVDDITDAVIHTMRTYGRDGAR